VSADLGALVLVVATGLAALAVAMLTSRGHARSTAASRALRGPMAKRGLAGIACGVVVLVLTGWVLAALVAAVAAAWATGSMSKATDDRSSTDVLEALVSWIENLRDVLLAGDQPIGAIRATVATAAPSIRPQVRALAARLGRQSPEIVLRRFADEVDDPIADLVAAGLLIAITRGARTVPVLSAVAEQARQQVDRRRLVEVERAPVRREVLLVSVVMAALLVGLLALARSSYLDAYDSLGGQLFLASMLTAYVLLLSWVQRLVRSKPPTRFLSVATMPVTR
jgi:hypothetical protein